MIESRQLSMMGTVIDLCVDHDQADVLLDQATVMLTDFYRRFSISDPNSRLMQINRAAGDHAVIVDRDLFNLIAIGKKHSMAYDSNLNIAIGPLVKLWKIALKEGRIPDEEAIQMALKLVNPEDIILDVNESAVYLAKRGMEVDLAALVKGYFADLIMDYFKEAKARVGFINLGGNVLTFGDNPTREDGYWYVGIQNPVGGRDEIVMAVKVKNQAVATSGSYENLGQMEGVRYPHIFDVKTGHPVQTNLASLTVVTDQSVNAEVWSTRLFSHKPQEIITELQAAGQYQGVVITQFNQVAYSRTLHDNIVF